jgi:hypothetical protein
MRRRWPPRAAMCCPSVSCNGRCGCD